MELPQAAGAGRRSCGSRARSGETYVQGEVPDPQVEYCAAGPVHDERKQDDGQDYYDHPEEEHDDAGDRIPRYRSRSSHGCQLPPAARFIRRILAAGHDHVIPGLYRAARAAAVCSS